jgi:hypothetical protein
MRTVYGVCVAGFLLLLPTSVSAVPFVCGGLTFDVTTGGASCAITTSESGRLLATLFPPLPDVEFAQGPTDSFLLSGGLWEILDPAFTPSNPNLAIARAISLGIYPNAPFTPVLQGQFVSITSTTEQVSIGSFVFTTLVEVNTHTQTNWLLTAPAVAEPGSLGLLCTAAAAVYARRRRRGIKDRFVA